MRMPLGVMRQYGRDAAGAFRQAPLEVAVGVATAVVFSITMRRHADDVWTRFVASAALALPLLFAASVLRARQVLASRVRWAMSGVLLLAIAAYAVWVLDPGHDSEGWRLVALVGAAIMAVSLTPTVGVSDPEARRVGFWRFNSRLLARIVTVLAYGGALFAALAGAVAAVTSLFDLRTPEQLYGDLAGAVFFAMVPWIVVGGIPELIEAPATPAESAPRIVRLLGRYLYFPVLAVYLAILLTYVVKVVATGVVPKNLLSPIILVAGAFGFLGSVFLEPLRRDPEHRGVAGLMRFLPVPMLVLLPFALWAVWVRRGQYGWTEFRYLRFALLVALLVLSVVGVSRLVRRRQPVLLLVPVVLGLTLLLSAFGPWGAVAVSRRNQQTRLREGLTQAGLLRADRLSLPDRTRSPLPVSGDVYERISGSLRYLYDEHGPGSVQPLFATNVAGMRNGQALLTALRLRPVCRADQRIRYFSASLPQDAAIPGLPAGTLYRVTGTRNRVPSDTSTIQVTLRETDALVTLGARDGAWSAPVDLGPIFARMTDGAGGACSFDAGSVDIQLPADAARYPLVDATGTLRGQLVLTQVNAVRSDQAASGGADANLRVDMLEGILVVPAPGRP